MKYQRMKNKKIETAVVTLLVVAALFFTILAQKEIELIVFIFTYNYISNCFKTRFHADTIYPKSAIKASFVCKIITIAVCIYFVITTVSIKTSFYLFIFQILFIALFSCLFQVYYDNKNYIKNLNKLKKKIDFKNLTEQEIVNICKEYKISNVICNRLIDHYIKGLKYDDIAEKDVTTLEAIRNCFNRAKNKINKERD